MLVANRNSAARRIDQRANIAEELVLLTSSFSSKLRFPSAVISRLVQT
jgi:hypothetical protein